MGAFVLRGPLSREHIQELMRSKRSSAAATATKFAGSMAKGNDSTSSSVRPIVPADIDEKFLQLAKTPRAGAKLIYRPAILGQASMHFVRATSDVTTGKIPVGWFPSPTRSRNPSGTSRSPFLRVYSSLARNRSPILFSPTCPRPLLRRRISSSGTRSSRSSCSATSKLPSFRARP